MKKSFFILALNVLFLSQSVVQAEEKTAPEAIEIVIKIDREPGEPNPAMDREWQIINDAAVAVARQCEGCTESSFGQVVDHVCECVRGMAATMKRNPCATGRISIIIKDAESGGVAGCVRKKSVVRFEENSALEAIEIVIRVDREPGEPNPTMDRAWDVIVDTAVAVARQCEGCTESSLNEVVDNVCECIKRMAATMKSNPCATGCISINIKDSEKPGVSGSVRKK